jgi:hypothetical protein
MLARDPQTKKFLDAIAAMGKDVAAEAAPNCHGVQQTAEQAAGASTSSPLDGVYRVTTTAKDLLAAGTPAGDVVPENYGTSTFVFDRGRFASTQEDKQACTWGYGTFAVKGNRVEWSFTDGGGIAPNNALNKPGEFFVFGWSLYRDTLTLTAVPGAVCPSQLGPSPGNGSVPHRRRATSASAARRRATLCRAETTPAAIPHLSARRSGWLCHGPRVLFMVHR